MGLPADLDAEIRPAELAARFSVPLAADMVVARPALFDLLTSAPDGAVTLLSAFGGWGKTLLVASWLLTRPAPGPVAWLSLDGADGDAENFWSDIARALTQAVEDVDPAAALRLRQLADQPSRVPLEPDAVAAALLGTPDRVLLVLDNLHELTSRAVHGGLLRLAADPESPVRVVACTRHDPPWPLHRLRLEGRLVELRSADLAFGAREAAALLAASGIELTRPHLIELVERTEGWPGGLRLAVAGLQRVADPAEFFADFSGDERSVADYLLSEVLEPAGGLPDFLVPISVVDVVCGDLADALTGRRDGARRLADLAAANLFVHAVGPPGRWYRLHRLVADVLRGRLTDPVARRDLHRRAASWYRDQEQPMYALTHAVEGAWWSMAAELTGQHTAAWVLRGSARKLDALLSRAPHEVVLAYPELSTGLAAAQVIHGHSEGLGELTNAGRDRLSRLPPGRRARTGVVLDFVEMARARLLGDIAGVLRAGRQLPDHVDGWARLELPSWDALAVSALGMRGVAETWLGADDDAATHLTASVRNARAAGAGPVQFSAQSYLALLDYRHGALDGAACRATEAVSRLTDIGLAHGPQAAASYLALAGVALDRDELAEADRWLAAAALVVAQAPEPPVALTLAAFTAQRSAVVGEPLAGLAVLRQAVARFAGPATPTALRDQLRLIEADLLRAGGDLAHAAGLLDGLAEPHAPEAIVARARLLMETIQAEGDRLDFLRGALAVPTVSNDVAGAVVADETPRRRLERELLAGLLASCAGETAESLRHLEAALVVAGPGLLRRPFLDQAARVAPLLSQQLEQGTDVPSFAADLLHRCAARSAAPSVSPPVDPLSERQLVVLHFLPSVLSDREIAAALFVSVNTIKSHKASIYRKLDVTSRREAVHRARSLGML